VVQLVAQPGDDHPVQRSPTGVAGPLQRIAEAPGDVDPRARVDQLQLAIRILDVGYGIKDQLSYGYQIHKAMVDLDKAVEALSGLTAEQARAIRTEYRTRTGLDLGTLIEGQQVSPINPNARFEVDLGQPARQRLIHLLAGTVAPTAPDPEQTEAFGGLLGSVVGGVAGLLGHEDADVVEARVTGAWIRHSEETQAQQVADATANRYRADAAQVKRALDGGKAEELLGLIRRPYPERQALAAEYKRQFGVALVGDMVARLGGPETQRAMAIWSGDNVLADRIALTKEVADAERTEAAVKGFEASWSYQHGMASPVELYLLKQQRQEAQAKLEARLRSVGEASDPDSFEARAEARAHLGAVLEGVQDGSTLGARIGSLGDPVMAALMSGDEPEQLAARLGRADAQDKLTAAELERGIRDLRALARKSAIRLVMHDRSLVPRAEAVIDETIADFYKRFKARFDQVDTRRGLEQALALGDDAQEARNRALLAAEGALPAWRELELALRQDPRDMDRVRLILNGRSGADITEIAKEYAAKTVPPRDLRTDLLGTPQQQEMARLVNFGVVPEAQRERRVLLGGGRFESAEPDEAKRLEEQRKWTYGRYFNLKRAVIENRGLFARARDWAGNVEKDLVEKADDDATDAASAMANALLEVPPNLAAARTSLAELERACRRLESNLAVYKEDTKAAVDAFVDFAVLAVTTVVTLGEGSAIVMAIRATVATIGTKLALKGEDYSVDEFLMDLRSGAGGFVGGKLAEGVLRPIAGAVAGAATRSGLSSTFSGRVLAKVGAAAEWEANNLIQTGVTNLATGNELTAGMGAMDHFQNVAQHGVQTGYRWRTGAAAGGRAHVGEESATRAIEEGPGRRTTGPTPDHDPWAARPVDEATPVRDEVVDVDVETPRVSMQLPEPEAVAAKGTRDRVRSREKSGEGEPTTGGRTRGGSRPTEEVRPAGADLEEHATRAERYPGDMETIRRTTEPDARARALAREFGALFPDWPGLSHSARQSRLEAIVNARLRDAGVPHVWIDLADLPPGHAELDMGSWRMSISRESIALDRPTIDQFAEIADNAAHEARHALHMFRGYRAALAEHIQPPAGRIDAGVLAAARDANEGHRTAEPLDRDAPAFGEALDIYRDFYGETPERGRRRERRRDATDRALDEVRARIRELREQLDTAPPDSPHAEELRRRLEQATQGENRLHNLYMSQGHEVDAWRMGSATRSAVREQLHQDRLATLRTERVQAEADGARAMDRIRELEASGADATQARHAVDEAMARERAIDEQLDRARHDLEGVLAERRGEPRIEAPLHGETEATGTHSAVEPGADVERSTGRGRGEADAPGLRMSHEGMLRESSAPDARARAYARDLAPIHAQWGTQGVEHRIARLEAVLNGPLVAAGGPPVRLRLGDVPPGEASFSPTRWEVTVSQKLFESDLISAEQFATLAESLAHEGRHSLHHFRGLRVAERAGLPTTRHDFQPAEVAVRAAEAANEGTRQAERLDLGADAFREGREVFEHSFGSGALRRKAVLDELHASGQALAAAIRTRDATPEGSPQRAAAEQALAAVSQRERQAHEAYMAQPQEIDAWRRGIRAKHAVLQQLKATEVSSLSDARARAATELRRARRQAAAAEAGQGDATAARARVQEALDGYRAAQEALLQARRQLKELQDRTHGATVRRRHAARTGR
jgi:hypothetical protein